MFYDGDPTDPSRTLPPPAPPPPLPPAPPPPAIVPDPYGGLDPGGDQPRGLPQPGSGAVGPIVEPHPQPEPPPAPPPPTGGDGDGVGGTDDLGLSAAIASSNLPDLSDLPAFAFNDPEAERSLSGVNPPLKGMSALSAIVQACADYDVDPHAAVGNALRAGADGNIGDNGFGYGPFLYHVTQIGDSPQHGKGAHNVKVNAWAWTDNGIRYGVLSMAEGRPSARGLHGHPACYAIVYGKQRPVSKPEAYRANVAEYDKLGKLGPGWAAYAAGQLAGPAAGGGVDTIPQAPPATGAYHPAGVVATWRDLIDVFKLQTPKQRANVVAVFDTPKEIFK